MKNTLVDLGFSGLEGKAIYRIPVVGLIATGIPVECYGSRWSGLSTRNTNKRQGIAD